MEPTASSQAAHRTQKNTAAPAIAPGTLVRADRLLRQMMPKDAEATRQDSARLLAQKNIPDEMLKDLLQKTKQLTTIERSFLQEMKVHGMAPEQMLIYIEAPRHSYDGTSTGSTRESIADSISNSWAQSAANFTKDVTVRARHGGVPLAALGTGIATLIVAGAGFATSLAGPENSMLASDLLETSKQLMILGGEHFGAPKSVTAALTGGAAFATFMTTISLLQQRKANRQLSQYLNVAAQLKPVTGGLMSLYANSEHIEAALKAIPKPQHHLIKHLENTDLRLFLLSDDATREAILRSNPPPHESRIQCVLSEDHGALRMGRNLIDATVSAWDTQQATSDTGLLSSLRKMRDESRTPSHQTVPGHKI